MARMEDLKDKPQGQHPFDHCGIDTVKLCWHLDKRMAELTQQVRDCSIALLEIVKAVNLMVREMPKSR